MVLVVDVMWLGPKAVGTEVVWAGAAWLALITSAFWLASASISMVSHASDGCPSRLVGLPGAACGGL